MATKKLIIRFDYTDQLTEEKSLIYRNEKGEPIVVLNTGSVKITALPSEVLDLNQFYRMNPRR